MQDYRKLAVWQKAHKLTVNVFAVSAYLKAPESWAVRDQAFRAAISIPSNIAEGRGRGSEADFRRFLWHSMGSCNELEYDLLLATDLGVLPREKHAALTTQLEEVRRMLTGLIHSMKS
jgi:four helix bundle protein